MAHIPRFVPVLLPWQRRLAEHVPGHGWYQGGERLRRVKPHYTFIWPKDGKRGSKMGRWKDIFANEGPDIHVAIIADKLDALIIDKGELSGLDGRNWTTESQKEPWKIGHRGFGISTDKKYDFRTRKYGRPEWDTWTDARWQEEPNEHFYYP